jgi:hypothetical protein
MSFYKDRIYPHIVTVLGNPEPIHKIRQQLIPVAYGTTSKSALAQARK